MFPQFDLVSFSVQVFYSIQVFLFAYLGYKYYIIAKISAVLKCREKMNAFMNYLLKFKDIDMARSTYGEMLKRFLGDFLKLYN